MEREIKYYIGKNTFCASYAVLNAAGCEGDAELFELSMGIPFGIKCVDMKSERFLTPYRNPNDGIDIAVAMWGIPVHKFIFDQKDLAFAQLCRELERGCNIVLGPLNMGKLFYIPLCSLYEGVDHYIQLRKTRNDIFVIRDSEGYVLVPVTRKELYKMWNVDGVYEAEGKYTFRSIGTQNKMPGRYFTRVGQLLEIIYKQMKQNLKQAEQSGQGSRAFSNVFEILKMYNVNKWKLSFLYELEHLIQRKMLALYFFEEIKNMKCEENKIVKEQIYLIACLYREIKRKNIIEEERLLQLGELERQLGEV